MPFARTGEYPIYFEEAGRGLPVILVHGHAVDLRVWDDVVPDLARAGYRVIRYDARGHGRSAAPDEGYTWDAHVRDLKALVANAGLQECVLVGHSMGGGIAMGFALEYPERTAGLALICSALPGFTYSEDFSNQVGAMREQIRTHGVHPTIEHEFVKFAFFDRIRDDADAMDKLRTMLAGYSGKEYLAELTEQPEQVIERLSSLATPTLVVSASEDIADFRIISSLLAEQIPGAELSLFEGAGHMLPMEQPHDLAAALVAFVTGRVLATPAP